MVIAILLRTFEVLAVVFALLTITRRNPVYSALFLAGLLVSIGAVFAIYASPFLGVIQIIVYAGAILVLFILVIMMINLRDEDLRTPHRTLIKFLSVLAAIAFAFLISSIVDSLPSLKKLPLDGSAAQIAGVLLEKQVVLFEGLSVLLIVAVVGAIMLARKNLEV